MKSVIGAVIVGAFVMTSFADEKVNIQKKEFNFRLYGLAEQLEYKDILAEESGSLFGVGGEVGLRLAGPLWVECRGELFGGTVDQETHLAVQTPSGKWCKSDTTIQMNSEYAGGKVEGVMALKLPIIKGLYFKPYAGAGNRSWTRTMDDPTYGAEEDWSTSYGIIGCGSGIAVSKNSELFGRIEVRLPFENSVTTEYVNYTGLADNEMEPHKDPSVYAEVGANVSHISLALFVETLRFNEPDPSAQDMKTTMVGAKLGLVF